jgi:hypothetical protein
MGEEGAAKEERVGRGMDPRVSGTVSGEIAFPAGEGR